MNISKISPFDSYLSQTFPYPKPLVLHVIENAGSNVLKKLHKCCKYLFIKRKIAFIEEFWVFHEAIGDQKLTITMDKLCLPPKNLNLFKMKLWITKSLYGLVPGAQIIEKIAGCDIKELSMHHNLTIDEFKKLNSNGNLEKISIRVIYDPSTNIPLAIDEILLMVPKAIRIGVDPVLISKNTNKNLLLIEHQVKIKMLLLDNIQQELPDAENFDKFLTKNLAEEAMLSIHFENNNHLAEDFGQKLREKINEWIPVERKPKYLHVCLTITPPGAEWPYTI